MQLAEMTWPAVAALSKDTPVIIPVGSVEQHSRHLPVFTDSMLVGEIVRRAVEKLRDQVLVGPVMWLGNSHHHMDFVGTVSAEPRTYLDLLCGLMECFIAHGFRRMVFVNGHGGNMVPGQQAVFEVRQKYRTRSDLLLLFASYWALGAKPNEAGAGIEQTSMGHACECETSMMLRLAPRLVGDYLSADPVTNGPGFDPAARGWTTKDRSSEGHIGDPRNANAKKGEALFRVFSDDVTDLLKRVIAWSGEGWEE